MKRLIGCILFSLVIVGGQAEDENTEPYSEELIKKAEAGDHNAEYRLGLCLFNGEGIKTNDIEAIKWITKAAEAGLPSAQTTLGLIYSSGEGVNKNLKKAFEWYMKAAEKGWPDAQKSVGAAYFSGEGIEQDYVEAVEWYTKAAEKGDSYAQALLGICYAKGKGVSVNQDQARKWLQKAAQQGNEDAKYFLEYVLNPKDSKGSKYLGPIGECENDLVKRYGQPRIIDEGQQALQFEKGGITIKVVMRSQKAVLITFEKNQTKLTNEEVKKILRENLSEPNWSKVQDTNINIIYRTSQNELANYSKTSGALTIATMDSMQELKETPISPP